MESFDFKSTDVATAVDVIGSLAKQKDMSRYMHELSTEGESLMERVWASLKRFINAVADGSMRIDAAKTLARDRSEQDDVAASKQVDDLNMCKLNLEIHLVDTFRAFAPIMIPLKPSKMFSKVLRADLESKAMDVFEEGLGLVFGNFFAAMKLLKTASETIRRQVTIAENLGAIQELLWGIWAVMWLRVNIETIEGAIDRRQQEVENFVEQSLQSA